MPRTSDPQVRHLRLQKGSPAAMQTEMVPLLSAAIGRRESAGNELHRRADAVTNFPNADHEKRRLDILRRRDPNQKSLLPDEAPAVVEIHCRGWRGLDGSHEHRQ